MATKKKSAKKPVKKNTGNSKRGNKSAKTKMGKGGVSTSADTGGDRPPVPPGKA